MGLRVGLLELVVLAAASLLPAGAAPEKTLSLLHSVNGRDFVKRGTIVLDAKKEGVDVRVENDVSLDAASVDSMMDTGLYQLKVVDEKKDVQVMTSVPACQLRRANFRDEISLTLGPKASVLSVTYTPLVSPLAPPCAELRTTDTKPFESKASFETATAGMAIPLILNEKKPPPGLQFFKRSESVGADRLPKTPDEEQPQGFLRKYWYIILPLMIMSLLGGGEEVPPQQQGGTAAPQPAAASTGPAPPAGGAARQRRGKRS